MKDLKPIDNEYVQQFARAFTRYFWHTKDDGRTPIKKKKRGQRVCPSVPGEKSVSRTAILNWQRGINLPSRARLEAMFKEFEGLEIGVDAKQELLRLADLPRGRMGRRYATERPTQLRFDFGSALTFTDEDASITIQSIKKSPGRVTLALHLEMRKGAN